MHTLHGFITSGTEEPGEDAHRTPSQYEILSRALLFVHFRSVYPQRLACFPNTHSTGTPSSVGLSLTYMARHVNFTGGVIQRINSNIKLKDGRGMRRGLAWAAVERDARVLAPARGRYGREQAARAHLVRVRVRVGLPLTHPNLCTRACGGGMVASRLVGRRTSMPV